MAGEERPTGGEQDGSEDTSEEGVLVRGTTSISLGRRIDAPPQVLFDLVADPTMHAVIDGSGTVRGSRSPRSKVALGDRFRTNMRLGIPYVISNKVVEYEEGRRIAWAHIGGWRWRWEFEPAGSGATVTETFDWGPAVAGPVGRTYVERMGFPDRNAESLRRSLERLDAYVSNTGRLT